MVFIETCHRSSEYVVHRVSSQFYLCANIFSTTSQTFCEGSFLHWYAPFVNVCFSYYSALRKVVSTLFSLLFTIDNQNLVLPNSIKNISMEKSMFNIHLKIKCQFFQELLKFCRKFLASHSLQDFSLLCYWYVYVKLSEMWLGNKKHSTWNSPINFLFLLLGTNVCCLMMGNYQFLSSFILIFYV